MEKGKQTTNLASISLSKIAELPVPVPPKTEAAVILERLHQSLAAELDCGRELSNAQSLSQSQRQSILKAAFEGRLVPQDPADEPAFALLTRLREVSPGADAARGRRGTKRNRRDPLELPLFAGRDDGPTADPAR